MMLPFFTMSARARADRAGLGADFDAERAAILLLTLSDGLLVRWLIDDDVDMRAELEHAVRALGLDVPPSASTSTQPTS